MGYKIRPDLLLKDSRVASLSNEEMGGYVRMLMWCADSGTMPADMGESCLVSEKLRPFFDVTDEVWTAKHYISDMNVSRVRAKAGKRGGKSKPSPAPKKAARPVDKIPPCPVAKIVNLFNTIMTLSPKVELITEPRKTRLRTIWRSNENFRNEKFWESFFIWASTVPWMRGEVKDKEGNQFKPVSFDTLFRPSNFPKYCEEAISTWTQKK